MEQTSILMALFALIAALAGVVTTSKPAKASDDPLVRPTWATWSFELMPVNDEYDARWTIFIGGDDKQGEPSIVLHEETRRLECKAEGEVKIDGQAILFDGGYLSCFFPDLIGTANEIITKLWGSQYKLQISGECRCGPLVQSYAPYAEAQVDVQGTGVNPLFYHPSIEFGLASASGRIGNMFTFSGEDSVGKGRGAPGMITYRSTYHCDRGARDCQYVHHQNGQLVAKDKRNQRATTLYTGAVTVEIGKRPNSKERFHGALTSLIVDPGCRGN